MASLERDVRILRKLGCSAWRGDVVGARILTHQLARAEELAMQLEEYRRRHAKSLRPGGRRAALMLRIPSAVSLRLDTLVAAVRDVGLPAYRHEVVGVLTLEHKPEGDAQLVAGFNAYRTGRVEDLLAPGVSLSELLEPVPPEQGPRPR